MQLWTSICCLEALYAFGTLRASRKSHKRLESRAIPYLRKTNYYDTWKSILFSSWHPRSMAINLCNIMINLACLGLVLDFTFRAYLYYDCSDLVFARLGAISDSSVKITVRNPSDTNITLCLAPYGRKDVGNCTISEVMARFDSFNDFVKTAIISGLESNTTYSWFAAVATGSSLLASDLIDYGLFKTAPQTGSPTKLRFLTTSCMLPGWPYHAYYHQDPLRIPGAEYMSAYINSSSNSSVEGSYETLPKFLIFLGDFIYYDIPFAPGKYNTAAYFQKYRQMYASSSYKRLYKQLPTMHVYDDHEIANNWDRGEHQQFKHAMHAYGQYQHASNPDIIYQNHESRELQRQGDMGVETYYSYDYGDCSFFLLDTRRYRSPNRAVDDSKKTMLGIEQLSQLLRWIENGRGKGGLMFIVSSVPFTKNWKGIDGHLDTWGGFLHERQKIINAIRSAGINAVVISGDRHEFAATNIIGEEPIIDSSLGFLNGTVHEFSISPLNMFYSFIPTYKDTSVASECMGNSTCYTGDKLLHYDPLGNSKFGVFDVCAIVWEYLTVYFRSTRRIEKGQNLTLHWLLMAKNLGRMS